MARFLQILLARLALLRKYQATFAFFFSLLVVLYVLSERLLPRFFPSFRKVKSKEIKAEPTEKERFTVGLELPDTLSFCGEKVPLHDPEVRERLDKELYINTYWQSQTSLILKRAPKFLPRIEAKLVENGLPTDLKYIAVIESRLENVISYRGATGYWQFMKPTAEELGLIVREDIDQRYDLEESTQAACSYLKRSFRRFQNWTLAAASYNVGMGGLSYYLRRQDATNFYDLRLNNETSRYIFRALAFKLILENPEKYHFEIPEKELYTPPKVKQHLLDSSITDLVKFSKAQGISYKTLRYHNPWLRGYSVNLQPEDSFLISLPEDNHFPHGPFASDTLATFQEALDSADAVQWGDTLMPENQSDTVIETENTSSE